MPVRPLADCAIAVISRRWALSAWRSSTIPVVGGRHADSALGVPVWMFLARVPRGPLEIFPNIPLFQIILCFCLQQFVSVWLLWRCSGLYQVAYHIVFSFFLLPFLVLERRLLFCFHLERRNAMTSLRYTQWGGLSKHLTLLTLLERSALLRRRRPLKSADGVLSSAKHICQQTTMLQPPV